jgi:hypothetical protein
VTIVTWLSKSDGQQRYNVLKICVGGTGGPKAFLDIPIRHPHLSSREGYRYFDTPHRTSLSWESFSCPLTRWPTTNGLFFRKLWSRCSSIAVCGRNLLWHPHLRSPVPTMRMNLPKENMRWYTSYTLFTLVVTSVLTSGSLDRSQQWGWTYLRRICDNTHHILSSPLLSRQAWRDSLTSGLTWQWRQAWSQKFQSDVRRDEVDEAVESITR